MWAGVRQGGALIAVACALAAASDLLPGGLARGAASFTSRFDVRLTVAPDLPPLARADLIAESATTSCIRTPMPGAG